MEVHALMRGATEAWGDEVLAPEGLRASTSTSYCWAVSSLTFPLDTLCIQERNANQFARQSVPTVRPQNKESSPMHKESAYVTFGASSAS